MKTRKRSSRAQRCIATLAVMAVLASCSGGRDIQTNLEQGAAFGSARMVSNAGDIAEEVRGVWIASVYNINFPSAPDLTADKLKAEMDSIIDNTLSLGMNTVFFQVHPAADALYKSKLFPVSKYLSKNGKLALDPLEYMARECRRRGVSLIAWINPLRVSVSKYDSKESALAALDDSSPAKDGALTVFYGDGKLYLNCGKAEVRSLVADTVGEIVSGYDVDGVIFDDYFYPYPATGDDGSVCEFDDTADYAAAQTSLSVEDWRRENVNMMIRECYERVKSADETKLFGVAPFGVWQNDDGTNGGSATSGMEAYSYLYCDALAWVRGGYVDFLSPQLYWAMESEAAPFDVLADWWNRALDGSGVKLIISHGVYRYDDGWDEPAGELCDQVSHARRLLTYRGSALYGYAALTGNSNGAADDAKAAFSDKVYYYSPDDIPAGIVIGETKTSGASAHFSGYSDPSHELTVNGIKLTRQRSGYFECDLSLYDGENIFTFRCGDNETVVTIKSSADESAEKTKKDQK